MGNSTADMETDGQAALANTRRMVGWFEEPTEVSGSRVCLDMGQGLAPARIWAFGPLVKKDLSLQGEGWKLAISCCSDNLKIFKIAPWWADSLLLFVLWPVLRSRM